MVDLKTQEQILESICKQHGAPLETWHKAAQERTLYVLGSGAGLTMAFCDLIRTGSETDMLGLKAADMPGDMGVEARATVIDYVATLRPCVVLLWCGIYPATDYTEALRRRSFSPLRLSVYIRGMNDEKARAEFKEMGAFVMRSTYRYKPPSPREFDEVYARALNFAPAER